MSWIAEKIEAILRWMAHRIRDRPGRTAEMERIEKATANLVALQKHGLSWDDVQRHRARMEGVERAKRRIGGAGAGAVPSTEDELALLLFNKVAFYSGRAARAEYKDYSEALRRARRGDEDWQNILAADVEIWSASLTLAQIDFRWSLEALREHDALDPLMSRYILDHEREGYMHPWCVDEMKEVARRMGAEMEKRRGESAEPE